MNLFNTNIKIYLKVKERSQATTVLTSGKYDTSFQNSYTDSMENSALSFNPGSSN